MSAHRIPPAFIDDLLARTDIINLIEPFVPLKKRGNSYTGLCPFHQEKTPSFHVNPTKQFYHCFGCGAGGNAIRFLMDYERLNFIEAIEFLASKVGLVIPKDQNQPLAPSSQIQDYYELMQRVANFYHRVLQSSPKAEKAREYLTKRGLSHEIVSQYTLGFAEDAWDNIAKLVQNKPKQVQALIDTGILAKKNSIYDRFRHRVIFPIRDERGRYVGLGGRVLNQEEPKYLNSPETPLFQKGKVLYGLYEVKQRHQKLEKLLVVEGYMDVLTLAQYGIHYALATLGTATTTDHLQKLFRLTPEVVFCFDGDPAGQKAAWHVVEILFPLIRDSWRVKFIFLPEEEDPDSLIRKEGKANFEARIEKASSFLDFFFARLKKEISPTQSNFRASFIHQAMQFIQNMPIGIFRELFLERLSQESHLEVARLEKYLKNKNAPLMPALKLIKLTPMRMAIMLLLQQPKLAQEIPEKLLTENFAGVDLLKTLFSFVQENPDISTGALMERFRQREEEKYLLPLVNREIMLTETEMQEEFKGVIEKLWQHIEEEKINQLMRRANQNLLSSEEKRQLQTLLSKRK